MSELSVESTSIPGLMVVRMPVHADDRGWFKENWQRAKMTALGLPDFGPVQNNVSFNTRRGATRGIHAEPWDKYVGVATGRVFAAWVDLREGASFGTTFSIEIGPDVAVFVPRGVGNSYQALEDGTAYTYLVNDHWRPGVTYPALALDDADAAISWPISLAEADVSEKDRANPTLADVTPMPARRTLVVGSNGQLGRALLRVFPNATGLDMDDLDITDPAAVASFPWAEYGTVLNAAAYTAVDAAETEEGRRIAWAANAVAPALLARAANEHRLTLVHYSSDYVFDGTAEVHDEREGYSPLGVYAQSKAAGDIAVGVANRHYVLRTSWVVGEGRNFVRTMETLARDGVSPSVVDDQYGRLTFTGELARATQHLLAVAAPFGTYDVTNSGPTMTWCDIAREVFELCGRSRADVSPTDTASYGAGKTLSPRPLHSTLDLSRIEATGFEPEDAGVALRRYLGVG